MDSTELLFESLREIVWVLERATGGFARRLGHVIFDTARHLGMGFVSGRSWVML